MAGEFSGTGGSYRDDLPHIQDLLNGEGVVSAVAEAHQVAAKYKQTPVVIMRETVLQAIYSDTANHAAAMDYLEWDIEKSPDIVFADALTEDMKFFARNNATRATAERGFAVAVAHVKLTSELDGFTPTQEFIAVTNAILARIESEGFYELHEKAAAAMAPVGFAAVNELEQMKAVAESPVDAEYVESNVNELLCRIAGALDENGDPEQARRAREAMTDGSWKRSAEASHLDHLATTALLDGNTEKAGEIMKSTDNVLFGLWETMRDKVQESAEGRAWADNALDVLLSAQPDYFSKYSGSDSIDIFVGGGPGRVLGLLGRNDVIKPLLEPANRPTPAQLTVMNYAYGLGQAGNRQAYEELLEKSTAYDEVIRLNFEEGLRNAI